MANKKVSRPSSRQAKSSVSKMDSKKTIIATIAIIIILAAVVVWVNIRKAKQPPKMVPLTQEQQQGVDDFANQIKTYYEQKYQK